MLARRRVVEPVAKSIAYPDLAGVQMGFVFAADDELALLRDRLTARFGRPEPPGTPTPIGQLVKSLISSRTRDPISLEAYRSLIRVFPCWSALARAPADEIECAIQSVTFADVKARRLGQALRMIEQDAPDFDLGFLADWGVTRALAWLERLPGVGRKASASALNFTTLGMPAFVIDGHILRILQRYGLVRPRAGTDAAYAAIMALASGWSAADLLRLHMLLKHLGQTICRIDRACCDECPLAGECMYAAQPQAT